MVASAYVSYQANADESSEAKDIDYSDDVRWLGHFSTEIIYKREYLFIYFMVSCITLFLVCFDLFTHDGFTREKPEPTWFIVLDCVCVGFLILEICFRYFAYNKDFWRDPFNKFDVVVMMVSIISISLYPVWTESDFFGACVLGTRYVAQTSRLLMFLKRWEERSNAQKSARKDLVTFDDNEDPGITFLDPSEPPDPKFLDVKPPNIYKTYQQTEEGDLEETSMITAPL